MKKGNRIEYNLRITQYRLLISTSLYYNYFPKDSKSCSFDVYRIPGRIQELSNSRAIRLCEEHKYLLGDYLILWDHEEILTKYIKRRKIKIFWINWREHRIMKTIAENRWLSNYQDQAFQFTLTLHTRAM